jgi:hypothetical protein
MTSLRRTQLSRRTVLRGAVHGIGASVGLPLLDAMLNGNGTALAQGGPLPQRFGAWYWGNGVVANQWFPAGNGPTWSLTPLMQPLANVKSYLSAITGAVVYVPYQVSGHMGSLMAITSGTLGTPQGGLNYAYASKTFDQAIAEKIGGSTRFRSLHLGVASTDTSDADFGAVAKSISHNGPNSPNLPEFDPIALYNRVFGAGFNPGGPGPVDVTLAKRKSVLDVVAADTRALQSKLGARDKARLDQHLQGITELERQLMVMPPPMMTTGCRAPARPASSFAALDAQQIQWDALDAAQTELLVFALVCDQTRVFTYRFSPCNDYTVYPGFPTFVIDPTTTDTGTSMHAMTHQQGGDQPGVQTCVRFAMTKLAGLLERLKGIPEATGNVLDNCAILAFSECTEGRGHNATQPPGIPMLVAGRAGGRLVYPGVHYRSAAVGDKPSETRGRNVSCVPLTIMQALSTGITTWGTAAGQATRPISELLV